MRGISASPGIAIGKVIKKNEIVKEPEKTKIQNTKNEIDRLNFARNKCINQIDDLLLNLSKDLSCEDADIFEAHKMIAGDDAFFQEVENKITSECINAEWALKEITDAYIQMLECADDEYIKERTSDIKDVISRIMNILLGIEDSSFSNIHDEAVIIAKELTPSDIAQMDRTKVLGFITETGSKTSHVAIMARTFGIPAVVGIENVWGKAENGDLVILNGDEGSIIFNPSQEEINAFQLKQIELAEQNKRLKSLIGQETVTRDNFRVELCANIGSPEELDSVLENDAEGIGLFRTEFLYMYRSSMPSEEEQFEAYKTVAERMSGKPVIIRTLDVGGDKELPYLDIPREENPFLGYRAIRICLDKIDIFKIQLRALLRASTYGNLKIMFPMISSVEELRQAKALLQEVKYELRKEKIEFNDKIEVGIMIEIPSAAIISDILAREADFFSIGTNDLMQYTVAVDRGNQQVSYLYNQYHPAVLRTIKQVIDNAHKKGIRVGMCGEAAADPKLIPILAGMGLDEFSMSSNSILKSRWIIRNISCSEMKNITEEIINLPTAKDVENYIDRKININRV